MSDVDLSEFRPTSRFLRIDEILDELDEEKRRKLGGALLDRSISADTIASVVTRWGHSVSPHAVTNWRRRNA